MRIAASLESYCTEVSIRGGYRQFTTAYFASYNQLFLHKQQIFKRY